MLPIRDEDRREKGEGAMERKRNEEGTNKNSEHLIYNPSNETKPQ
jgi:hypothetical protein